MGVVDGHVNVVVVIFWIVKILLTLESTDLVWSLVELNARGWVVTHDALGAIGDYWEFAV